MKQGIQLYTIKKDVKCIKCGNIGAVQYYGNFHPSGLGDELDKMGEMTKSIFEKYRNEPYMSHAMGFGGTIPHQCLNCGNIGLIDFGSLEGYDMAFKTIKNELS